MSDRSQTPLGDRGQPAREEVCGDERLMVLQHPLAEDLLTIIRDNRNRTAVFGAAAERLATFLLWEACRDFKSEATTVPGFSGDPIEVRRLYDRVAGIIILRAGEVFAGPFRRLFPDAALYHVGIQRDEATLDHRVYLDNVPNLAGQSDRLLILDPMLATGGSIAVAIERARRSFPGEIRVVALVAAPIGVQTVLSADGRTTIVTAALDERLDSNGYILPGLGDAGDRFFGTDGST